MLDDTSPRRPDKLEIWTIYDHPKDFPSCFVARKYLVDNGGAHATDDVMISPELAALRSMLSLRGLYCLPADPNDDSKIMESWI